MGCLALVALIAGYGSLQPYTGPLFIVLSSGPIGAYTATLFPIAGLLAVAMALKGAVPQPKTGEYCALIVTVTLGATLLGMSSNLLMVYLSLELVSLASYLLTAFGFQKQGTEAALKYLLFGGVSSGIMLFGLSLLYGLTGTLSLGQAGFGEALWAAPPLAVGVTLLMVLAGFLFKISATPFHIWAPDVYQAAPTPIAAFFSVAPKIAGLVVLARFCAAIHWEAAGQTLVQDVLAIVAILSMTVGNFSAIWQTDAKRLLAYSSIAHSGFLLSGVVAYSSTGIRGMLFYAAIYLMMNFAAFLLVQHYAKLTGETKINHYKGMGKTMPYTGIAFLIVMAALTGLPPTAGFTAKFLVFAALLETYQASGNTILMILFVVGLLHTVVSLFYYLKIPYYLYFKNTANTNLEGLSAPMPKLAMVLALVLIVFFFKPDWLMLFFNSVKLVF